MLQKKKKEKQNIFKYATIRKTLLNKNIVSLLCEHQSTANQKLVLCIKQKKKNKKQTSMINLSFEVLFFLIILNFYFVKKKEIFEN